MGMCSEAAAAYSWYQDTGKWKCLCATFSFPPFYPVSNHQFTGWWLTHPRWFFPLLLIVSGNAQRCVSQAILNPSVLSMKISHQVHQWIDEKRALMIQSLPEKPVPWLLYCGPTLNTWALGGFFIPKHNRCWVLIFQCEKVNTIHIITTTYLYV